MVAIWVDNSRSIFAIASGAGDDVDNMISGGKILATKGMPLLKADIEAAQLMMVMGWKEKIFRPARRSV